MAYRMSWLQPDRLVLQEFWDEITAEDMRLAVQKFAEMLQQGTPPVHLLTDATGVKIYPKILSVYAKAFNYRPDPERIGWVVVMVPDHPIARFIANVVPQTGISGMRFRIVTDYAEAGEFLSRQDITLELPPKLPERT